MIKMSFIPPTTKRVEKHTNEKINNRILAMTIVNINKYKNSSPEDITKRIIELRKEWDTERFLEANAAVIVFISAIFTILFNINWAYLILFVSFFLLYHAVIGWCPPLPLIRRLNFRTPQEINREIMTLKFMRGDFNDLNYQEPLDFLSKLIIEEK